MEKHPELKESCCNPGKTTQSHKQPVLSICGLLVNEFGLGQLMEWCCLKVVPSVWERI